MAKFVHQRHKPPVKLSEDRELVIVCPSLRSKVNLSRIVRVAGCFGVRQIIACRPFNIDPDITRDAADFVTIESRQSLPPVLKKLKAQSYRIVGLEQATESISLYEFAFERRTALLLGHERTGIDET